MYYNYYKRHLFHLVKNSPWPLFVGLFLFFFVTGIAFFIHRIEFAALVLLMGFLGIIYVMRQWFYDIEDEASLLGYHTLMVKTGIYKGFMLFVTSEIMLFFGFFWAFFQCSLSPSINFELSWPFEDAFVVMSCLGFPAYNTILLMVSGMTVTYAHYAAASGSHSEVLDALYITVFLGILFLMSQVNEYFEMAYNLNDSMYACSFFMLTGLHGMHVLVGVFFLYVCLERFCFQEYHTTHYLGFVCAIWYWHFVDAVWVLLYFIMYCWGNWMIQNNDTALNMDIL